MLRSTKEGWKGVFIVWEKGNYEQGPLKDVWPEVGELKQNVQIEKDWSNGDRRVTGSNIILYIQYML